MSKRVTIFTLALVAGGAVTLPLLSAADAEPARSINDAVQTRALTTSVPERRTMTDEIEHFTHRVEARPDESFSKERLFAAHMLAFRAYGDAAHLDRAEEIVAGLDDGRPAALRSASSLHLADHDFQAAVSSARRLAEEFPSESASYRLFDALWSVGDKAGAQNVLEGSLDTLSTSYLSRRARVIDGAGFTEPARDLFRRVVENVEAYAEPAPIRAWALVELGHFELHSGHPDAAVRSYLDALEVLPGSPAALEGLASVAYGVDRNLEAARDLYEKALAHGAHLDLMPTLADIEEALGNTGEASHLRRAFIDAAKADSRREAMLRRPLAFLLAETPEMREEAVRLARLDLRARQDQGAFDALAWALYRSGEVEMAWTLVQRALAAGGPPPPVLFRAGLIAEAAGEAGRAAGLLEEALQGRVELAPHEVAAALDAIERVR